MKFQKAVPVLIFLALLQVFTACVMIVEAEGEARVSFKNETGSVIDIKMIRMENSREVLFSPIYSWDTTDSRRIEKGEYTIYWRRSGRDWQRIGTRTYHPGEKRVEKIKGESLWDIYF